MDPLAQLKAIHTGDEIHNYPLAYGWWILLFIFLALTIWGIKYYLSYRKRCYAKRLALAALVKEKQNPAHNADNIFSTVKWVALQYFPRKNVASLTGSKLEEFLSSVLPTKHQENFTQLIQPYLSKRYLPNEEDNSNDAVPENALPDVAILWVKTALPPKKHVLEKLAETPENQSLAGGTAK